MEYASEMDLLFFEPKLHIDAAGASQTLIEGTGALAGSGFTIAGGSFVGAGIQSRMVLTLRGLVSGCFVIASVESATHLTAGPLTAGIEREPPAASPIGTASDLPYAIRSFWAQRIAVSRELEAAAGAGPESGATILNPWNLRMATALGTLALIFAALSDQPGADARVAKAATDYRGRYERARRNVRLDLDFDGDGEAELRVGLNERVLKRV